MLVIFTYVYVYSEMNDELFVNRKAALGPMSRAVRPRGISRHSGNVRRC